MPSLVPLPRPRPPAPVTRSFSPVAASGAPRRSAGKSSSIRHAYRSAIFYGNAAQREIAERCIRQIEAAHVFDAPIATTLEPLEQFYEAEPYHHEYAARNPDQPYIRAVAEPKVEELRAAHADMLKERA